MNIGSVYNESLSSVRQALGIAMLDMTFKRDASAVATIINDMSATNKKTMEASVTPHKGSHIDVSV